MRRKTTAERWILITLPSGFMVKAQCAAKNGKLALPRGVTKYRINDPRDEPTAHEIASRALFATRCTCAPERWDIVVSLPPGGACDYADATPGVPWHLAFGQAIKRADGTWAQEPRSPKPVLLAWKGESK